MNTYSQMVLRAIEQSLQATLWGITGSPESVTVDITTYQAALQDLAEVMWLMEHVVPQTVTSDILRIRADNEYARAHLVCGIVCLSFDDPPHPPTL